MKPLHAGSRVEIIPQVEGPGSSSKWKWWCNYCYLSAREVQHYHYQLIIYLTERERVFRSRIWRNITAVKLHHCCFVWMDRLSSCTMNRIKTIIMHFLIFFLIQTDLLHCSIRVQGCEEKMYIMYCTIHPPMILNYCIQRRGGLSGRSWGNDPQLHLDVLVCLAFAPFLRAFYENSDLEGSMNDSWVSVGSSCTSVWVCVWVRARVCVISSWVAGCRQPGRDKRGWMEGALRVCVCVCVHVCVHVGKSLHKGLEVCVLLSTSAGLGGDKQTAKYSPCVFPAKTGGGIPTTQTDATGSGLEWATRWALKNKASVMVSVALSLC